MAATVVAVCVVHQIRPDRGRVGRTAIDKRPVEGPVQVGPLGLDGDLQADNRDHGGVHQAVYSYAREEAQRWAAELGEDVPPGRFGENLATRGLPVTDTVLGERWRIGDMLELEVTGPRIPCATFGRFLGQRRWVRRFSERADVGAYCRVRTSGAVAAGDPVRVVHRPGHGVTVREVFVAAMLGPDRLGPGHPERLRRLAEAGLELNRAARIALTGASSQPSGLVGGPSRVSP